MRTSNKVQKYVSFHRQLNSFGWTQLQKGKYQGLLYNPLFHRKIDPGNFDLITQKNTYRGTSKKVLKKKLKKKNKGKVKKAGVTVAKNKNKAKSLKLKSTSKNKGGKKIAASRKKTVPVESKHHVATKKRKTHPSSSSGTVAAAAPSPTSKSKQATTAAKKRVTEYKKLHRLFGDRTMWNAPVNLDVYLLNGKIEKLNKKRRNILERENETEVDFDNVEYSSAQVSKLLCNEDLTGYIDGNDEKQSLTDLVDKIRQDKEEKVKRENIWSEMIHLPIAKGKILPPSKFKKPTDKWRILKVGNIISVYWRDDEMYYNAIINKQQENTSYFHLIYDDDGAQEWLDLSREEFKVINDNGTARANNSKGRSRTNGASNNLTHRQGNQNMPVQIEPIILPDDHSYLAPFLRYSWYGLGLGTKVGTPAYNSFIKTRNTTANEVTALEILNDVRSLRNKGFSLSPQEFEINNENKDQANLMDQLRSLQNQISQDYVEKPSSLNNNNDETLSDIRRLTENWSIRAVKENLRTMETQIINLNEKEAEVLEKCKQKGLLC